jgi:hypothetical protein
MEQQQRFFEDYPRPGRVADVVWRSTIPTKLSQLRDFFYDRHSPARIRSFGRALGKQKALLVKFRGLF